MRPQSIARLSVLFALLMAVFILGVIVSAWNEIESLAAGIRVRETAAARKEINDAFVTINRRIKDAAQSLVHWDETKQQLSYPEFYPIWRDTRVRDAGILPGNPLPVVALYDRQGNILNNAPGPDPMPLKLPGTPPLSEFRHEGQHDHIYHFAPVFANASNSLLLGYVGLKFGLLDELKQARSYSYADLSGLRINLPENVAVPLEHVLENLEIRARPNPAIETFTGLFRASQMRQSLAILGTMLLAAWLLNHLVVRPLRRLSAEIDALRAHADDRISAVQLESLPLPVLELENVRRSFNEYQSRLADLHQDLARTSQDFFDQARHDALTGAFNRRAFDEDWREGVLDRRLDNIALLLFDCDHFKAINDTYGHNVGDAVIQGIARSLQEALRADDRLYRIGGDEFATVMADTDAQQTQAVAERCLEHVLAHDFMQYGLSEPVTISIGVAISEVDPAQGSRISLTELQKRADLAMYAAKRPGGQKVMFYTPDIGSVEALVVNRNINAVFQAIQDPGLIEIAYQAVVRLPALHREYSEALARIRFEDQLIYPGDIFPIVQNRNLDADFDLAILRAISRDMDSRKLPEGQGVSINISAPGIVNTKVVDTVVALVEAERGRKIVLEITETALITQMETATANIRRLREAGALVALDDFGSGYSSLRYLASMPVDLVKFDMSMVSMLESGEPRQRLMIEEIARMVIVAGYELVAEGIEHRELLENVIRLGFSHAQGYYFGKPGAPSVNCIAPPAPARRADLIV